MNGLTWKIGILALGLVAIVCCVGDILITLAGREIPPPLISLPAVAIGAIAGLVSSPARRE